MYVGLCGIEYRTKGIRSPFMIAIFYLVYLQILIYEISVHLRDNPFVPEEKGM